MNERGDCRLHTTGFSGLALISFPVWALYKRLYKIALVAWPIGCLFNLPYARGWPAYWYLILLVPQVLCGIYANRIHLWVLERSGYRLTAQEPKPAA